MRPETPIDTKVLVAEACRLTDRLDKYDKILRVDPSDPVRSEARLAASALHRILNGLSYETHGKAAGDPADPPATSKATTIADEIAARRAARQADSAG